MLPIAQTHTPACRRRPAPTNTCRERRRTRIAELLAAEGLGEYDGMYSAICYVERQEGSEAEVLEAARQRRAVVEAQAARGARMAQLLEAEGLPAQYALDLAIRRYIENGRGSEQQALAEAKRSQRSAGLAAAMQAEGLPNWHRHTPACTSYIGGSGSLEEALASARQRHQEDLQRQQRSDEVQAALSADGLPARYAQSVPVAAAYIASGFASLQAALDAARAAQQLEQQGEERQAVAAAALAAEGLPASYCASVPAVRDFIRTGDGEAAEWRAAARERHQLEQQQKERRQAVQAALEVHSLPANLVHSLPAAAAWIQRGEGSEAAVLEAAASYRPPPPYFGHGYAEGFGAEYYSSDGY